jgi:hypothetical protein
LRGRTEEAEALARDELPGALAAARASDPALDEQRLCVEESDRIRMADALVELMAPLLVEQLRPLLAHAASRIATTATLHAAEPAMPMRPAAAGPLSIADFIDGMLAQERAQSHHPS